MKIALYPDIIAPLRGSFLLLQLLCFILPFQGILGKNNETKNNAPS